MARVDEVNEQIPTIIFAAKDGSGSDLSAASVKMDGELLTERLEGTALSIDPGEHTFTFETVGQPPVAVRFMIQQAQKDRRETITIGTVLTPPVALPTRPEGDPPVPPPAQIVEVRHRLPAQSILALVAGGIGVAGVGVGTAFGLLAVSRKSDAQSACPSQCPTQDGVNKWHDASSAGTISTVGFVVGGIGIATGATLWLASPRGSLAAGTKLGIGPGGLDVQGAW